VDRDRFVSIVEKGAGIGRAAAERAVEAVLETLAERISEGEARDLQEQLPPEIAPWLGTKSPAEGFGVDEFLRRVAEREGVDVETAEEHTSAVFTALGQVIDAEELEDLRAQLSKDFAGLLPRGPFVEVVHAEKLFKRVAERAAVDPDRARDITAAVLETLAERIAGGEVDDLVVRLPVALHPPLERGKEATGGKATSMSLDEFLARVADRTGVTRDVALDYSRAVFQTLREAVGERELLDVTDELPAEYESALAR
jgi:uncharacterized protein (DUF2267 family)